MDQKTNETKGTIEIEAKVLRDMKAGEEQMALTIQNLADQLDEAQDELKTTKESLRVVTKDLRDTRLLLHSAVELQEKAEDTATACENVLKGFLMRWLTSENQERVKTMLRFYHPVQRVKMMNALLTYLLFGKKMHLEREVEKTHFRIVCEKIDEDAVTLPSHSLMVNLMQKYGLFEKIND
jgi:hypothetical protein